MNIVVDGYNICYKTTGTGDKTVVILQGWGTDLGVYDSVALPIFAIVVNSQRNREKKAANETAMVKMVRI